MSTPLFQRSPRTFPPLPTQEVEIQAPPAMPTRPASSLVLVLLPFGFTLVGLVLSMAFMADNPHYLLVSLPLMAGSAMVGIITYSNDQNRYKREIQNRQTLYRQHLQKNRQILEGLAEQQRRASQEVHPDPERCLAIAYRQTPEFARHLWERSSGMERPRDPDFLEVRLGVGTLPALFSIKIPPPPSQVGEPDELYLEAVRLGADFRQVERVAVSLPLGKIGAVGFTGPRLLLLEHVRAFLVSVATLHAPTELKMVALFPHAELPEWVWMRWLPHVWDDERKRRFLAATPEDCRALISDLFPLLQRRVLNPLPQGAMHGQNYLFIFADPSLYFASSEASIIGPLLHLVLTRGAEVGAYGVFLQERREALPGGCGALVDLYSNRVNLVGPPTVEIPFTPDRLSLQRAEVFSRILAPLQLRALTPQVDLPSRLSLFELLRVNDPSQFSLIKYWDTRDSHQSLEVPLGLEAGGGVVTINFQDTANRGDGSHAMIGGTTGTGKTRFLQTLILLLAAHHHPHDLNFVLIDYKGGDLLQGLEGLPHVVGTLANLEKAGQQAVLIERLFICLEAELRRRRNLLGGRNINEYQREHLQGRIPDPLPHLFVVIDEFAEMIRNSPDRSAMTKRLLSIGATGRSLGVHLVLATQDPSGVVNEELRNNINIRICLRMGSREASTAILRRPDAFDNITSAQVGRAYLQVGNDDRFSLFQVAWGGDPYIPGSNVQGTISLVALNGERKPLRRYNPLTTGVRNQLEALAENIRQAARTHGITPLRSPLSPPLRDIIYLDDLRTVPPAWNGQTWGSTLPEDWLAPLVGQTDDPSNQAQDPFRLPLAREGHLALFGEPGSGKTTFIQTLVVSLAQTHTPADLHIYLLDFSGQRLLPLKGFPHVGDVFLSDDLDRIRRLFRFLQNELQERKTRFARMGVTSLGDYRALSGENLPAYVVILEDYATFHKLTSNLSPELDDTLAGIVRDGGGYGFHFIFTLAAPTELKPRLANAISLTATFHLASGDYSMAIGPTGGIVPPSIAGRGLLRGPLEFQAALPVPGNTDAERSQSLKSLMEQMNAAWKGVRPRAFAPLPAVLPLTQVLIPSDRWMEITIQGLPAPIGLYYDDPDRTFEVALSDGPYFLVVGPALSGKTTLLQCWALSLAEKYAPSHLSICLVDFRRQSFLPLSVLPHISLPTSRKRGISSYVTDSAGFATLLGEINTLMQSRQSALEAARHKQGATFDYRAWRYSQQAIVLFLDDVDLFQSETPQDVKDLFDLYLKKWRDLGFYLVVAGNTPDLENAWGWVAQLRNQPVGFQLGSASYNGVFKVNIPSESYSKNLTSGEAYYIARGRFTRLKFADPSAGSVSMGDWVQRIVQRTS